MDGLKRASLNYTGHHDSAQNRFDVTCTPKNPMSVVEGDRWRTNTGKVFKS